MGSNPLYAACIRRAAQQLGGYDALAERVGVSAALLERWAQGGEPTELVFLKVVDILLADEALVTRAAFPPPSPPRKPAAPRR